MGYLQCCHLPPPPTKGQAQSRLNVTPLEVSYNHLLSPPPFCLLPFCTDGRRYPAAMPGGKLSPACLLPETMHICNLLLEGSIFCTKYSRLLLRRANVHPTGVSELEWGPALLAERGQPAGWIKQLLSVPAEWTSPHLPFAGSQRSHQKLIHQLKGLSVVTLMAQLRHLCTQRGICSRCLCHMRSNMPFS